MSVRWCAEEQFGIDEIRRVLAKEISETQPFPEVIGDRRLIRFLHANGNDPVKAIKQYGDFLAWRKENKIDEIRQKIVYEGCNSPFSFPHGEFILKIAPQIVMTAKALDKRGQPIALEHYNFNPDDVLKVITIEDYLQFLIYSLEFRSLIVEQLSHESELQQLHDPHRDPSAPYGVAMRICHIRDMNGISFSHLGKSGRTVVAAALKVGLPNYPDLLGVGYHINVPWVFNAFWYFVKQFLDAPTIEKINLMSSDFMDVMLEGISHEMIPKSLGGLFESYNEPFEFDVSPAGPLWYPGAPETGVTIVAEGDIKAVSTSIDSVNAEKDTATVNAQVVIPSE